MTYDSLRALAAVVKEARALAVLLREADAVQWQPTPRKQAARVSRSVGGPPSDPTASVALDAGRLAVRAQVHASEAALVRAASTLRQQRVALAAIVNRHADTQGVASPD